jgi:hypothetical protein
MAKDRFAAIDLDEVGNRALGDLSAVEFMQVLSHPKLTVSHRLVLADKKKYELWVEEGPILKLPIKDIIEKIRGEKKKVEYEIPPWMKFIPEDGIRELEYGNLLEDIAGQLAATRGGRS